MGDTAGVVVAVAARVDAIHPDLAWEHAPGATAENALVVTAEGRCELRSTAERWLRSAPPADNVWEFYAARQPDPRAFESVFQVDDVELEVSATTVAFDVDEERALVDVVVHHPDLFRVGESQQRMFTFLVLDWLLGEDGVERWIGSVEWSSERPSAARAAAELAAAVSALDAEDADAEWAVLSAETPSGNPIVAVALARLKPIEYPLFDQHIAITLPYRDANAGQLPVGESRAAMDALADRLDEQLSGHGVQVAHESAEGVRTIHIYADAESTVAGDATALAAEWPEGEAVVKTQFDPCWEAVASFRGS